MADANISVPMKLDAFIFNQDVCDGGPSDAKIAPIKQPNYTFMRIKDDLLQNDLLDSVNMANTTPYNRNARLMDLGTGKIRENRLGVYVHWSMPRFYRSGVVETPEAAKQSRSGEVADNSPAPVFRSPPTRWLVIRKLDVATIVPANAPIKAVEAWIIESDRVRELDGLDQSVDLQVDVSPYIESSGANAEDPTKISIDRQAEIFIGYKESAETWRPDPDPAGLDDRVNLSLLNSSNQLFPDYQPHNSNVFSILDSFAYRDLDGEQKSLTDAVADYYVIGWHTNGVNDPFILNGESRSVRLNQLNSTLNDMSEVESWLESTLDTRTICHGAMYEVEWHSRWRTEVGTNRPRHVLADEFASKLINDMPIALGTTPMDTLLAYIHAHHNDALESDINQIASLLRAQSDSITDQQAGEDEVQNYNFSTFGGGVAFVLPIEPGRPAKPPTAPDQDNLKLLNQAQALLDSAERALRYVQWGFFSLWWMYITNVDKKSPDVHAKYAKEAESLNKQYGNIKELIATQKKSVEHYYTEFSVKGIAPKVATLQSFVQAREPTLLIAGAEPGWPVDWLKSLICRLDYQIATFDQPSSEDVFKEYSIRCVPDILQKTALALVKEFVNNKPPKSVRSMVSVDPATVFYKTFPPLYHDRGDPTATDPPAEEAPWRDRWNSTQPWFPLFVEWEIEFFHVEYDKWALHEFTSRLDSKAKFRHGIKAAEGPLWEDKDVVMDTRVLSGRILINPQPTFSLKAQIDQLFQSTPPDVLEKYLKKQQRDDLQNGVSALPYMASPLSGFVSQLVTMMEGNHFKPNIRVPGGDPKPLVAAYEETKTINLGEDQLKAMGVETDLTPYGTTPLPPTDYSAFKPVAHGQFRFTKLNVLDKFGQCAPAIDQHPRPTGFPPLYPCLSDYFAPQSFGEYANVAIKPEHKDVCEFAQVPPQINQSSRLNAYFVLPDNDATTAARPAYWRPMRDFEDDNPIWGWIVVNYVDNGIQFFLRDGTFYREARVASENNPRPVSAAKRWQPFSRGSGLPDTTQIDRLISRFTDTEDGQVYLENFITMITDSVNKSKPSPTAYGQFVNSLVGKPLALVNIGFSLELSSTALISQSSLSNQKNKRTKYHLLTADGETDVYQFPLKLGDRDRLYDGLVGYFRADDQPWKRSPSVGNELDLDTLYTYLDQINTQPGYSPINNDTFPNLQAFYQDPLAYVSNDDDPATQFRFDANSQLNKTVFGCIMDPFLPLHAYMGGGVAPVQNFQLPDWTWQSSLKNMTAFFHFGPILVTDDVPKWDAQYELPANYADQLENKTVPGSALELPSLKVADWRWLQGYSVEESARASTTEPRSANTVDEKFMALGLGKLDATPRFQPGPFTAIEGYLQMKQPIETDVETRS